MRAPKSQHGTVVVQSCKDRLRLVWTCLVHHKRRFFIGLPDSAVNRRAAQMKALSIQNDIGSGNYDETLVK
jgi:integrase